MMGKFLFLPTAFSDVFCCAATSKAGLDKFADGVSSYLDDKCYKVFYYRMCSLPAIECVIFYYRMCSLTFSLDDKCYKVSAKAIDRWRYDR